MRRQSVAADGPTARCIDTPRRDGATWRRRPQRPRQATLGRPRPGDWLIEETRHARAVGRRRTGAQRAGLGMLTTTPVKLSAWSPKTCSPCTGGAAAAAGFSRFHPRAARFRPTGKLISDCYWIAIGLLSDCYLSYKPMEQLDSVQQVAVSRARRTDCASRSRAAAYERAHHSHLHRCARQQLRRR